MSIWITKNGNFQNNQLFFGFLTLYALSLSLSIWAHYTLLYAAFMYREKNGKEQLGWPLCVGLAYY